MSCIKSDCCPCIRLTSSHIDKLNQMSDPVQDPIYNEHESQNSDASSSRTKRTYYSWFPSMYKVTHVIFLFLGFFIRTIIR